MGLCGCPSLAQSICGSSTPFTILHYTGTSGFDHNTRSVSATLFSEIGANENFMIVDTDQTDIFSDIDSLMTFAAVVFSNTSGNSLFNATEQQNFQNYINSGKGFLGIHAATDTYRTGWAFYNELVGGIVQTNPNHTSQNHVDTMRHRAIHPILNGIPDPWVKQEEYYYWDLNGGMVDTVNFTTALRVDRTGSQSYDRSRPITWFRRFNSGARSFYTALGHKGSNYTDPTNDFRRLVRNGICWVAKASDYTGEVNPGLNMINDLFIGDENSGVIIKSNDGSCWRLIVDNAGGLSTSPVECPEE